MAQYFSKITADHWTAKNRLETAALQVAKKMERKIVSGENLESFKKEFIDKIAAINMAHPRCKPLQLDIWKAPLHGERDISFSISSVFNLNLFAVDEYYKNGI